MTSFLGRFTRVVIYLSVSYLCTSCQAKDEFSPLDVTSYNHMVTGVGNAEVTLLGHTAGAGYLWPGDGGGSYTCCISVPTIWRPGLIAKITFETHENGRKVTITQDVEIPKYEEGDLYLFSVHFLYNHTVKAFVTKYTLGHRKYPLKGKEAELVPGKPIEIEWE